MIKFLWHTLSATNIVEVRIIRFALLHLFKFYQAPAALAVSK